MCTQGYVQDTQTVFFTCINMLDLNILFVYYVQQTTNTFEFHFRNTVLLYLDVYGLVSEFRLAITNRFKQWIDRSKVAATSLFI